MKDDETQIRELVSQCQAASKAGNIESVLALMSDDVVFLVTGRPDVAVHDTVRVRVIQR